MALIAVLLHIAFCAESPLTNSALRHSFLNWSLAGPNALPGILLSLVAVPILKLLPRLRPKWAAPIAMSLWIGLIIRLATYAIPEQHLSSTYSASAKAAVSSQSDVALTESLEAKLKQVASAANSATPIKISSTTEIFKVLSNRTTLIYHIRDVNFVLPEIEKSKLDNFIKEVKPSIHNLVSKEACTNKVNLFLLNEGVTIRYEMHDKQKTNYMAISVKKSDCR
jgi:hypothetical protein